MHRQVNYLTSNITESDLTGQLTNYPILKQSSLYMMLDVSRH